MKTQVVVQLVAIAAATVSAAGTHVARSRTLVTRSETNGFVTEDDTWKYMRPGRVSGMAAGSMMTFAQDGSTVTCLPVYGGMTQADCQAAISQIDSNGGDIIVNAGTCRNWVSGTCLARVCAESNATYTQDAESVADSLSAQAIETCVPRGESAVVSDCEDYASDCGTYRLWLVNQDSIDNA